MIKVSGVRIQADVACVLKDWPFHLLPCFRDFILFAGGGLDKRWLLN